MNRFLEFNRILVAEGLPDWSVRIIDSGGGLCVFQNKEIWIDKKYENGLGFFLHELAHALVGKEHQHDVFWGDKYTSLVCKYLDGIGVNEFQA